MEALTSGSNSIDEVHRRIGRNLLRFLEIETGLKLVLPYLHPDGGAKGAEALREFRDKHVRSRTLGPLLERLSESINAPVGFFEKSFEVICNARNKLIHHFYDLPEVNLLRPDRIGQALDYLDRQFHESEELYKFVRLQSLCVLTVLIEQSPALAAEYGRYYEALRAQLGPYLEVVDE
jgi:hypothetical protein